MTEQRASKNFRSSVISELGRDIGFSWAIVYEVAMPRSVAVSLVA